MHAQDQLQPLQDTIERIYGDTQVQLGIRAPTPEMGTVAPGAAKVSVRHYLKPWELSARLRHRNSDAGDVSTSNITWARTSA